MLYLTNCSCLLSVLSLRSSRLFREVLRPVLALGKAQTCRKTIPVRFVQCDILSKNPWTRGEGFTILVLANARWATLKGKFLFTLEWLRGCIKNHPIHSKLLDENNEKLYLFYASLFWPACSTWLLYSERFCRTSSCVTFTVFWTELNMGVDCSYSACYT